MDRNTVEAIKALVKRIEGIESRQTGTEKTHCSILERLEAIEQRLTGKGPSAA
jgi:hypothetical protein